MAFVKNLRAKILLASLIPGTLALVAVALIALFAYEGVARNVVQQRDTELAKISAARLSEGLTRHGGILQTVADDDDLQSLEPARIGRALERVQIELFAFDAGVVIYNDQGVAVGSDPFAFKRRGKDFPVRSEFDKVQTARRPSFSNVFEDAISGDEVILVTVPIVASGNEFKGVVAGMSTLKSLVSDVTYSKVLEITAGRKGFAYLVDGQGRTIYHRDTSLLGESLAVSEPVSRATRGETGAVIADDPTGESVISGFAPVPDADFSIEWAVITQDRWKDVVGPIRRASRLILGLLVLGGVLASALVFFAIGRILKPVKELTQSARRIAGGDFDHTIAARTGDEIQALADQFNTMAVALKESYADLERKVAERTEELRESNQRLGALIEAAPVPILALDRDAEVRMWNPAAEATFGWTEEEVIGRPLPLVPADEQDQQRSDFGRALQGEALAGLEARRQKKDGSPIDVSIWTAPLRDAQGDISGVMGVIADLTERKRAEEALRESEHKYRTLFDQSRDAIFVAHENRVLDVNRAALAMFGYTREQALDILVSDVYVHAADQERMRQQLLEHSAVQDFEAKLRKKDGTEFDGLFTATRYQLEDDRAPITQGIIHDITERKRAEELFRTLAQSSPVAMFLVQDGKFRFVNSQFERVTGYSADEVVGRDSMMLVNAEDRQKVRQSAVKMLKEGVPEPYEYRARSKSGGEAWIMGALAPIEYGERPASVGTFIDITDRKEAEEALRQSEQRTRLIIETAHDAFVCIDADGMITDWNPQAETTFGWPRSEAVGRSLAETIIPPQYREEHRRGLRHFLATEEGPLLNKRIEIAAVHRDGHELPVELTIVPVRVADTYIFHAFVRDITEHKEAEETLRDLAVLEERNRMARELHDTMAQGFTGIILQMEAAEQAFDEAPVEVPDHLDRAKMLARECLQEARRSVWNLLPKTLEERPLADALDETVQDFDSGGRAKADFSVSGERRELADDVQVTLLRICQESLTNIKRHAAATEVTVDLAFKPDTVRLVIHDNGVGFDLEELRDQGRQGGFGLTGMKQRARLVRGTLSVKSQKGRGVTVEVVIPT